MNSKMGTRALTLVQTALMVWLTKCSSADNEWVVGSQKVDGSCKPVGGLTAPGIMPFPYSSEKDCMKNKMADNFNNTLPLWEGYVLEGDETCLKVWARAGSNPFTLTNKQLCERERADMTSTIATVDESSRSKRTISEGTALAIGKTVVDTTIMTIGTAFPLLNLLRPLISLFWPTAGKDTWAQTKAKVKRMINQNLNEAYAYDLENFLKSLRRELSYYNDMSDSHSGKLMKIIAIDNSLGVREDKFVNKKNPKSTLTYFVPYVSLRLAIKQEMIRVTKTISEKQMYAKQFIVLCMRYIPLLGAEASTFTKWRLGKLSYSGTVYWDPRYWYKFGAFNSHKYWEWRDEITGEVKSWREWDCSTCDKYGMVHILTEDARVKDEADAFVASLRTNLQAWSSMFNTMAASPLIKGRSIGDSTSWSTLASDSNCKMSEKGQAYMGKISKTEKGVTCQRWDSQSPHKHTFRHLEENYCRNPDGEPRPWCYTTSDKRFDFCDIPLCAKTTYKEMTVDGKPCQFPFTYKGQSYSECITLDKGKPWCMTKDASTGDCLALEKLNVDLSSCVIPKPNFWNEQYFGHTNVAKNGKACAPWSKQTKYKDFSMDNNSVELAGNYCRNPSKEERPWCYLSTGSWEWCNIRECSSSDWQ